MACGCTDKKKQDYDYVRKLANAESLTKKIDIQIYFTFGYDGKTKYYDYEESNGGRKLQVVKIIRFSEPESLSILPNIEFAGFESVSKESEIVKPKSRVKRTVTKPIDSDSGAVL
jgi:hypothetical protein